MWYVFNLTYSNSLRIIPIILLVFTGIAHSANAQDDGKKVGYNELGSRKGQHKNIADSFRISWIDTLPANEKSENWIIRGICKQFIYRFPVVLPVKKTELVPKANSVIKEQTPLLKVKGNVLYDVNYRSRIDTPYAENNIYQHTIQTRLDFVYKDQYPFKLYLTTHFSNSSLFRKYTDMNLQYTQADFVRIIKNKMLGLVQSYMADRLQQLDSLRWAVENKKANIASLTQSINGQDLTQRIVEDKEKNIHAHSSVGKQEMNNDSLLPSAFKQKKILNTKPDTTAVSGDIKISRFQGLLHLFSQRDKYKFDKSATQDSLELRSMQGSAKKMDQLAVDKNKLESKKKKVDTLLSELRDLETKYRLQEKIQTAKQFEWKNEIEKAKNAKELDQVAKKMKLPDSLLPKGYKTLYALQSVNVGRFIANYSELSVKNINITGGQAEFNPRYYYAVAAGKVDYRFRDYIVPNQVKTNQYIGLVRVGKGTKNGNHIIFTYYTGRRQFFNSSISATPASVIPEYNLSGISIEVLYKLNKTTFLVAEVAKSTAPFYSLDSSRRKNWMGTMTSFKDRHNEAYSLMLNSYISKTQTRILGSIRYIGANFQSFSTYTSGASQLKWVARAEQPLFKKQLTLVSSVQQNDYDNPFVTTSYKTSSLLASFQATFRRKKWPIVSVGYFPSYQLTRLGDNNYSENRYYSMVGNAGYYYQLHGAQMSSCVVYSQFYNAASDSSFVYFNSKNILFSQNINIGRFSYLLNLSESINTDYRIHTIENSGQFFINKIIGIGAGIKMIKQTLLDRLEWGYSGNLSLRIPKLGDIQFMMDKGYIPGMNRQLVDNKMGRLTYLKTF